jgi:hypothetical protein
VEHQEVEHSVEDMVENVLHERRNYRKVCIFLGKTKSQAKRMSQQMYPVPMPPWRRTPVFHNSAWQWALIHCAADRDEPRPELTFELWHFLTQESMINWAWYGEQGERNM